MECRPKPSWYKNSETSGKNSSNSKNSWNDKARQIYRNVVFNALFDTICHRTIPSQHPENTPKYPVPAKHYQDPKCASMGRNGLRTARLVQIPRSRPRNFLHFSQQRMGQQQTPSHGHRPQCKKIQVGIPQHGLPRMAQPIGLGPLQPLAKPKKQIFTGHRHRMDIRHRHGIPHCPNHKIHRTAPDPRQLHLPKPEIWQPHH